MEGYLGLEGWKGEHRDTPWDREQGNAWERAGKGERCHKDATDRDGAEETPGRGWEEGRGVTGTLHTGRVQKRPHKWAECRGELSTGTPQREKCRRDPV